MIILIPLSMIATLAFMVRCFVRENELERKDREIKDLKSQIDLLEGIIDFKR